MKDIKKKLPLNKLNKANKNYNVRCYWGCVCRGDYHINNSTSLDAR